MKNKIKKITLHFLCGTTLLFSLGLFAFLEQKSSDSVGEIIAHTNAAGGVLGYLHS